MSPVVDAHAHIFPDRFLLADRTAPLRRRARHWLSPAVHALHKAQTWSRLLPAGMRETIDGIGAAASAPALMLASTRDDFLESMEAQGVDAAVIIAPPHLPNEFVIESARLDRRLIPIVAVAPQATNPGADLENWVGAGAKGLKIHPSIDGLGPESPHYSELLAAAEGLNIPVIIHTGCLHIPVLYKDGRKARADLYAPWFKRHPSVTFILAHMNWHEPGLAMDLAEEHRNVLVDTSWQPPEIIGEAVRRIGAERVLFGSDWPFVGDNLSVGIHRVRDCVSSGMITDAQAELVLGANAARVFGWEADER
jgi:predicted TIM-barrel fold metal-dependent hydrolase